MHSIGEEVYGECGPPLTWQPDQHGCPDALDGSESAGVTRPGDDPQEAFPSERLRTPARSRSKREEAAARENGEASAGNRIPRHSSMRDTYSCASLRDSHGAFASLKKQSGIPSNAP